mmetsp:Transcript_19754/g.46970  ORF Transcript_19754/g.46970 Transcript_19754/m.46970 type:complete len:87 (-) Transcript_19754:373-633(-)
MNGVTSQSEGIATGCTAMKSRTVSVWVGSIRELMKNAAIVINNLEGCGKRSRPIDAVDAIWMGEGMEQVTIVNRDSNSMMSPFKSL